MTKQRRKYDPEFKLNAVTLSLEKGTSVKDVAEDLGINKDLIYQWRKSYQSLGETAFPGNGCPTLTPEQERIKDLERRLKDAESERDILKKAMIIFSRTQ